MPNLDEAHAAFQQAARDEQLTRLERVPIHLAHVEGLPRDVEGVCRLKLHSIGKLEGLDARFELRITGTSLLVFSVEFLEQVQLSALFAARRISVSNVFDEFFDVCVSRVDVGALVYARKER